MPIAATCAWHSITRDPPGFECLPCVVLLMLDWRLVMNMLSLRSIIRFDRVPDQRLAYKWLPAAVLNKKQTICTNAALIVIHLYQFCMLKHECFSPQCASHLHGIAHTQSYQQRNHCLSFTSLAFSCDDTCLIYMISIYIYVYISIHNIIGTLSVNSHAPQFHCGGNTSTFSMDGDDWCHSMRLPFFLWAVVSSIASA